MNHVESKNPTLEGRDIIFECGQCGKSLSIDCRGAGLNVPCPQCGSELEVPIPEGFDLAELDKEISASAESDEELKAATAPLDIGAASSDATDATGQIEMLKAELETIRAQRQSLPYQNADILKAVNAVHEQANELRKALDKLSAVLHAQTGQENDET